MQIVPFTHVGFGHRRVAVHDRGAPAVVVGPGVANRQAELVGLAGRVAVERERAHGVGRAAVHVLGQPGVRDHELAAVEHGVAHEAVDERVDLGAELGGLGAELRE